MYRKCTLDIVGNRHNGNVFFVIFCKSMCYKIGTEFAQFILERTGTEVLMFKKVLLCAITVFFSLQYIVGAVPIYIENVPTISKEIFIPESYGVIERSSFDKYLSTRFVILLKDAHCNYDAQHNIARILEVLVRDYKVDIVAIEGAVGFLDYTRFEKLENEIAREKMASDFVKKGILTGAEYLKIAKDGKITFSIYGIEDEKLYMDNFVAFRETIEHLGETLIFIDEVNRIVKSLKLRIYPEGLLAFDNKSTEYYENIMSLTDWVKNLKEESDRIGILMKDYPNILLTLDSVALEKGIDFKKVEIERAEAINSLEKILAEEDLKGMVQKSFLFRLGRIASKDYYVYLEKILNSGGLNPNERFPNLTRYIELVKLQSWINSNMLFEEVTRLEECIKKDMFQNNIQRQLNDISKKARILKGLFNLTLTREDIEYYRNHRAEFMPANLLNFINIQAPIRDIPVSILLNNQGFLDKVNNVINDGEKFYNIAVERDTSLVENTLRVMEEKKKSSAVMVIGGFHTDGIIDLFEAKGIGYVVISPKIVKAEKEGIYLSLMMDKRIQKTSLLAFLKLLADGDNVARLIVPLGAEGWRKELLQMAMSIYNKYLGLEAIEEKAKIPVPFVISKGPDGKIIVERNSDYTDTETPDMMLEWFRRGLEEVVNEMGPELKGFVTQPENLEKYLGRAAVVEYRLRAGYTVSEGILRRATKEFIEFYLGLCKLYEDSGWLGVQRYLGTRWKEFLPESIKVLEFGEGYVSPGLRDELISKMEDRAVTIGIDKDIVNGIINYLFTMPAYGIDEKGEFYQALFFSSYMRLIKDIFELEKDEILLKLMDRLQSYRFLQVYLSKIFGVTNAEPILEGDNIKDVLESDKGKRVELLARYLSGEEFPGQNENLEKFVRRKLPEWKDTQWIKVASGVTKINEGEIADPLKRDVYITALSRVNIKDILDASDRFGKGKENFENGLSTADEILAKLKNRTFIHDVSMYLGDVKEIEPGKYEYSDLGTIGVGLLRAIQLSKENDQYFLYETEAQKEAMKAYLTRYGIMVEDRQFKKLSEYKDINREGRIIVAMLSDGLKEKVGAIKGDRLLIGNQEGTDLMLMNRLALVIAEPLDIEKERDRIETEIKDLFWRYYSGTVGEDGIMGFLENISIEKGILRIILPRITPFVREYYNILREARETISRAA